MHKNDAPIFTLLTGIKRHVGIEDNSTSLQAEVYSNREQMNANWNPLLWVEVGTQEIGANMLYESDYSESSSTLHCLHLHHLLAAVWGLRLCIHTTCNTENHGQTAMYRVHYDDRTGLDWHYIYNNVVGLAAIYTCIYIYIYGIIYMAYIWHIYGIYIYIYMWRTTTHYCLESSDITCHESWKMKW